TERAPSRHALRHIPCQTSGWTVVTRPSYWPASRGPRTTRGSHLLDTHLRDTATVDRRHLEAIALDLDDVADLRDAPETAEHEPADGVVRLARERDLEAIAKVVQRHESVDTEGARRLFADPLNVRRLELVAHLADQLLEDVRQRHDAGRPAELVDDDRETRALPPELREGLIEPERLRDERHAPHEIAGLRVGGAVDADEILHVDHADHVVQVLAIHREAREAGLARHGDEAAEIEVLRDGGDLRARDHHLPHDRVGEIERVADDDAFALLQHTLPRRSRDEHLELLVAVHVEVSSRLRAHRTEHRGGAPVHQPDEGIRGAVRVMERVRRPERDRQGPLDREVLWREFAEDD